MNKTVFIITHFGSKHLEFATALNENERLQVAYTNNVYYLPTDIYKLLEMPHKCRNTAAVYIDVILNNINFQCKRLYDWCDFIYLVHNGDSLKEISEIKNSYRYYCFRLRRIYEMAKKTKNAILLTTQDLQNGKIDKLNDFLHTKTPININPEKFSSTPTKEVDYELITKAQDRFEYYLYKLKQIPHLIYQ